MRIIVPVITLDLKTVKLVNLSIKIEIVIVMNMIAGMKLDIKTAVKLIPQNLAVNYYIKTSGSIVVIIQTLEDV